MPPCSSVYFSYKFLICSNVYIWVLETKKSFPGFGRKGGGEEKRYVTRQMTVEELVSVPPAEKERQGYVIQELSVSKLALTSL